MVSAGVFAVSACGSGADDGEERGYATPRQVCGVAVQGKLLRPLLPPGQEISASAREPASSVVVCDLEVDGKPAFSVTREWWEKGWSANRFARSQAYVQAETEADSGDIVYSSSGAVSLADCRGPEAGDQDLFLVAKTKHEGVTAVDMRAFITAYTEAVESMPDCSPIP
jgi:hypothetical protein